MAFGLLVSTLLYAGHLSWLLQDETHINTTKETSEIVMSFFIITNSFKINLLLLHEKI